MKRGSRQRPPCWASRPQLQEEEGIIDWDELTSLSSREPAGSSAGRGGVGARGTANGRFRGNGNVMDAGRLRSASRDWSTGRVGESVDVGRGRGATAREWSTGRGGGATSRHWSTGSYGERRGPGTGRGATMRELSTGRDRVVGDWNSGRGRGEDQNWDAQRGQGTNRDLSERRSQGGIQEGVSGRHPGHPELGTDRNLQRENYFESGKSLGGNPNFRRGFGARVARGAMHRSSSSYEKRGGRALGERGRGHRGTWDHRGDSGYSESR